LIADGRDRVTISSRSRFRVVDGRGRWHRLARRHVEVTRKLLHFRPPLVFVPSTAPLALNGSRYRGNLVVRRSSGTLRVVNALRVEDYLRGVVPWEMPSRWRQAALCAQAVAARTYALATSNPGATFDLYADTRDQMYGGLRAEKPSTNRAVAETSGRVLTWNGAPALTYYSSTSGGRTESASDAWGGSLPYLRSVADPYDSISPHHSWGPWHYSARTLARRFGVPSVADVIERWNSSGRVASVALRWNGGARVIGGDAFRSALQLPSTWFTIRVAHAHRQQRPTRVRHKLPALRYIVVLSSTPLADGRPHGEHVARSDSFPGLRPGYWVVYRGPYATRAEAARHAAGGYVRRLV
jgi:stage II sporulation protein D